MHEVFEQAAMFDASDPRVRLELLQAIAQRLDPTQLTHAIDRARLAYLRAYDPARVQAERFAYVRLRKDHSVEEAYGWRIDPLGVFITKHTSSPYEPPEHELLDQCFVAGPPTPFAPAWHRNELRARAVNAQTPERALAAGTAFQPVNYQAIARKDWSWDQTSDGESFAGVGPGFVLVGYQYQHDYGTGTLVPERVLAAPWATRISLPMPAHVLGEIRAELTAAGQEPPMRLDASTDECHAAYAKLAPRVSHETRRARSESIRLRGFEKVASERQWQQSAALGLFASLAPERRLSVECMIRDARLYGFGEDSIFLSTDGAAVIKASHCFGAWAGGVDEWWHVVPSEDRRAVFNVGTDYSQNELLLELDADTEEAFASLKAHCVAYFSMLGLRVDP